MKIGNHKVERIQKLSELLNSHKIIQSFTYYHTERENIFTACILIDADKHIAARGVSIKSDLDAHRKSEAQTKAFGRAVKALVQKKSGLPITRLEVYSVWRTHCILPDPYKSAYYPQPTAEEQKMLSKIRREHE